MPVQPSPPNRDDDLLGAIPTNRSTSRPAERPTGRAKRLKIPGKRRRQPKGAPPCQQPNLPPSVGKRIQVGEDLAAAAHHELVLLAQDRDCEASVDGHGPPQVGSSEASKIGEKKSPNRPHGQKFRAHRSKHDARLL